MRVLHYNWVDYLDPERRGGGVSVYQRRVLAALAKDPDIDPSFLSAGLSYDLFSKTPRWERTRHGPRSGTALRYEIVNSATVAPSHHSFGSPAQLDDPATEAQFFDFVDKIGPFDVIHFNNLEGLPVGVMAVKDRYPKTRIVLTLHNYYPFCPQVNLWFGETAHCDDFHSGARCETCLPSQPPPGLLRKAHGLAYHLKCAGIAPGTRTFDWTFRIVFGVGRRVFGLVSLVARRTDVAPPVASDVAVKAETFRARRADMIARINRYCDRVLCVSERVREIAEAYGIASERLETCYVGTPEAQMFDKTQPRDMIVGNDGILRLGYFGYMRTDKGFFFLLDALEEMPRDLAKQIHLLVAARSGPPDVMVRLQAVAPRLAGLRHVDGYDHDDLDNLVGGIDLGVIPVLWEDNLPQVAIEMHTRHVPILVSDRGGAQELAAAPDMVFPAGDAQAFADRVRALLNGDVSIDAYWSGAQAPMSMERHVSQLKRIYSGRSRQPSRSRTKSEDVHGTEMAGS